MPHPGDNKARRVAQSLGPCRVPASTLESTAYLRDLPLPALLQPGMESSLLSCPVLPTSLDLFSVGKMGKYLKYLPC